MKSKALLAAGLVLVCLIGWLLAGRMRRERQERGLPPAPVETVPVAEAPAPVEQAEGFAPAEQPFSWTAGDPSRTLRTRTRSV